jgi:hypothetical protein
MTEPARSRPGRGEEPLPLGAGRGTQPGRSPAAGCGRTPTRTASTRTGCGSTNININGEGDPTLSVRGDTAVECWRIVEPVLTAWRDGEVPLSDYRAGSAGPGDPLPTPGW